MLLHTDEGDLDVVMTELGNLHSMWWAALAAPLGIHQEDIGSVNNSMKGILTLWLRKVHVWTRLIPRLL